MFQKLFQLDNGFFRGLSRVTDLVLLNVLFLISSIPIITIGPALVALYSMTLKMVKNEEPYIIKGYFEAFRKNFKQGILLGLLLGGIVGILGLDFSLASRQAGSLAKGIQLLSIAAGIVIYLIFLYVFPIAARFEMNVRAILKNAFLIAIGHFPQTVLLVLMSIPMLGMALYSELSMYLLLTILILIGFSLLAFCQSFLFRKVFRRYEPEEENDERD